MSYSKVVMLRSVQFIPIREVKNLLFIPIIIKKRVTLLQVIPIWEWLVKQWELMKTTLFIKAQEPPKKKTKKL